MHRVDIDLFRLNKTSKPKDAMLALAPTPGRLLCRLAMVSDTPLLRCCCQKGNETGGVNKAKKHWLSL
jgi:hypothetical protein